MSGDLWSNESDDRAYAELMRIRTRNVAIAVIVPGVIAALIFAAVVFL